MISWGLATTVFLIEILFFSTVNFLAYKKYIKTDSTVKRLFAWFLTFLESVVATYAELFLVHKITMPLVGVLGIMAISDLEDMEVPGWTLFSFPAFAVLNYITLCLSSSTFIFGNIIAAASTFAVMVILGRLYGGMLGGADIIMATGVALAYGLNHTLYTLIIGCILSIICMAIYSLITKTKIFGVPLPFLPGLTVGFLVAFFI